MPRDVPGIGENPETPAARREHELTRLPRVVRNGKRLDLDAADRERAVARERLELDLRVLAGERRERAAGAVGREHRRAVAARERGDAPTMVPVLVRDEHGGDVGRRAADRREALLEVPVREPAVDQEQRRARFDEQRVTPAAARERREAQHAGLPSGRRQHGTHQESRGPLLPPPGGEYIVTGNCATLPPSTFVILLTPCFSTSSMRSTECSGRNVLFTPSNSLLMRSSVGSTTTVDRVPNTSFSTS